MMRQIEMELAKRERHKSVDQPWWADVMSKAISNIPEQQERALRWQEMKGEQARKLMTMRAGDYENIYDNTELGSNISGLEGYINKNRGKWDSTTIEYADILMEKVVSQRDKNDDFNTQVQGLDVFEKEMFDTIQGLDRTGVMDIGSLKTIKDMNKKWLEKVSTFEAKHGDRLSKKPFEDVALRLNQGSEMNLFLLQSAKDDDWLRDDEFEAWKESWEFRSASPINKFMAADKEKDDKTREDLSEMTREYAQNYMKYDNFIQGKGTLTIGDATYDSFATLKKEDGETAAELMALKDSLLDNAKKYDTLYQKNSTQGSLLPRYGIELPDPLKKDDGDDITPPSHDTSLIVSKKDFKEKKKELRSMKKDLKKLQSAQKYSPAGLQSALKNLNYPSIEAVEQGIQELESNMAEYGKMAGTPKIRKKLISMGIINKDTDINAWLQDPDHKKAWEQAERAVIDDERYWQHGPDLVRDLKDAYYKEPSNAPDVMKSMVDRLEKKRSKLEQEKLEKEEWLKKQQDEDNPKDYYNLG